MFCTDNLVTGTSRKQSKKKSLGGFVTEVGQLEFLLNTEENIHNLKEKKKRKTYFISFFLPNFTLAWEMQKDQVFPKLMAFSQHSPTVLSSFG